MSTVKGILKNPNDKTQDMLVGSSADICFFEDGSTVKDKYNSRGKEELVCAWNGTGWVTLDVIGGSLSKYRYIRIVCHHNATLSEYGSNTVPIGTFKEHINGNNWCGVIVNDGSNCNVFAYYVSDSQIAVYNQRSDMRCTIYGII